MKRTLLITLAVVVVLVAGVVLYGNSLPRVHRAASEITLPVPPDTVWRVVRNPAALVGTWPEFTRAERVPDAAGREIWDEEIDGFVMRLIVSEPAPWRMTTTILAEPEAAFGGEWEYRVIPGNGTTTVRVTESGWISNPVFRVMMALAGPHQSLDGYLTALGRHFGHTVTPTHLE